jgi:ATP-dependent Zn protease
MGLPTLRATAIHEAGHAVVALHFGHVIHTITIKRDGDILGSVTGPGLWGYEGGAGERKSIAKEQVIHSYAGLEAERLFFPEADADNAHNDELQAFDLLRVCPPRGCRIIGDEAYLARLEALRREARRLVKRFRPQLEIVADALMERETLSGEQLAELLGGWPANT